MLTRVKNTITLFPSEGLDEDEYYDEEKEIFWTIDINPISGNPNFKGVDAGGLTRWHWPNYPPPSKKMVEAMKSRLMSEGRKMPDGSLD